MLQPFPLRLPFLILWIVGLLAGCAAPPAPGASDATTEGAAAGQSDITLTYMASQGWIVDAELELAKQFEEETGIHIDFQIVPADQYFNVLQTRLNSGEGTDIFGGQSGKTDMQILYNITENGVDLTGEEWLERADPLSVEQTTLDGAHYGLTIWDPGKWPIIYNKQIFADHGLSVPTNFDEFLAVCQTLLDAGITPIYEPVADGWHHVMWFPEIGPRFEEVTPGLKDALNANEATFADDPTMLEALQDLQTLYDTGCFGSNTLSDAGSETEAKLASGEYAMTIGPITLPNSIEAAFPDTPASTFGYMVNPLADNQILGVQPAGPSKFIYAKSPNVEAAKEYFRFLTRPENLQYLLDNEPTFSTLNFSGVQDKLTEEQRAFLENVKAIGTVYQVDVNYLNPQWMDIGRDLVAMFTDAAEPQDVLRSIDQRRADMAAAAGDPAWSE
jgi:raffinose/stachyose/melibiose transport system substrate-binding protein